jgi:hypothetical protein
MFCLEKVDELVRHWQKMFRRSSLAARYQSSLTLTNNTPNASFSMMPAPSDLKQDLSVPGLPFVAQQLFQRLLPIAKSSHGSFMVIRIFDMLLPFVQLYIESVASLDTADDSAVFTKRYLDYAQFYLDMIFDLLSPTIEQKDPVNDISVMASALLTSAISFLFPQWMVSNI